MLLTIDIGNTNICLGLFDQERLIKKWRLQSDQNKTVDEYCEFICSLLKNHNIAPKQIKQAIIGSVSPNLTSKLFKAIDDLIEVKPKIVDISKDYGIQICIDNPLEIGADRIINALAGYHYYQSGLIIVDFGTATTFDIVSEKKEYLGGVISIGLQLSLKALIDNTAKLPYLDLKVPKKIIGKNTVDCMQSGLVEGYASMIDGLIDKIKNELDFQPRIIATGGLARMMHKVSKQIEIIHDDLTLEGLFLINNMTN